MNSSFSNETDHPHAKPVTSYLYRDIAEPGQSSAREPKQAQAAAPQEKQAPAEPVIPLQECNERVQRARAEAVTETEARLRGEYESRLEQEAAKVRHTIEIFQDEQKSYFARVETDVVHLALAIATKILHRESQIDPLLVAALVRVAIDKLHDGSRVSLRVSPAKTDKWRKRMANPVNGTTIAVIEDPQLDPDDCILETDLGSANFSIDAQLKEVEQGFFDLLAQRPQVK